MKSVDWRRNQNRAGTDAADDITLMRSTTLVNDDLINDQKTQWKKRRRSQLARNLHLVVRARLGAEVCSRRTRAPTSS